MKVGCILLLLYLGESSFAATAPDAWKFNGDLGLSLTQGNADSLRTTAGFNGLREGELWSLAFELDAIYGKDEGATTNERLTSSFSAKRKLTSSFYTSLNTDLLYDSLASIDYRSGSFATLGYHFIKSKPMNLRIEAGPGLLLERRSAIFQSSTAYQFRQYFDWQLSPSTKLFQSLGISGSFDTAEDYLLQAETGLESSLTGPWSLRLVAKALRYGRNTAGTGQDDFLLTLGLGYAFDPNDEEKPSLSEALDAKEIREGEWVTTALLGGSFARGNSDSSALSLGLMGKYKTASAEHSIAITGNYAENQGQSSARNISVDTHTQVDLSECSFGGLRIDFDHDDAADLNYRSALSPYVGYRLIRRKNAKLTFETGPSAVFQNKGGEQDEFFAAYATLKGELLIGQATRIFAECNGLSNTENISKSLIITTLGLDHSLADKTKLKVVLRSTYDQDPARGRENNDLSLVSGLEFEL